MNERILGRGLAVTLALALSLTLLAAAIYLPATSEWIMLPMLEHYAPPADTRLPAGEYPAVAEMITAYLRSGRETFQHVFMMEGTEYAAFNQKEQQHMADVQGLFRLCHGVLLTGGAVSLVMLAALARRHDRHMLVWFRRTIIAILAAVTAVILLAVIDFDALFVLFHKVAFTNDLWLLDPRNDLLIRLMPLGFFISYVAIIGCCWLLGMGALLVISTIFIRKAKERE